MGARKHRLGTSVWLPSLCLRIAFEDRQAGCRSHLRRLASGIWTRSRVHASRKSHASFHCSRHRTVRLREVGRLRWMWLDASGARAPPPVAATQFLGPSGTTNHPAVPFAPRSLRLPATGDGWEPPSTVIRSRLIAAERGDRSKRPLFYVEADVGRDQAQNTHWTFCARAQRLVGRSSGSRISASTSEGGVTLASKACMRWPLSPARILNT